MKYLPLSALPLGEGMTALALPGPFPREREEEAQPSALITGDSHQHMKQKSVGVRLFF
jgi:hypothetical protein